MKLTKDDPKLTAYAFGELSPSEMREVAKAIAADPSLKQEVDELVALESLFNQGGEQNLKLSPHQRAEIFQAGAEPDNVVFIPKSSWTKGVVAMVAAAAVLVVSLIVLQNSPPPQGQQIAAELQTWDDEEFFKRAQVNTTPFVAAKFEPAPNMEGNYEVIRSKSGDVRLVAAEKASSADLSKLPEPSQIEKRWSEIQLGEVLRVPLYAGNVSFTWISNALKSNQSVTPTMVRAEEVINALPTELPTDLIVEGVQAGVELVQLPWEDGVVLAVVRMSSTRSEQIVDLGMEFSANVSQQQIVGYNETESGVSSPARMVFGEGEGSTALYKIKLEDDLSENDKVLDFHVAVTSGDNFSASTLSILNTTGDWESLPRGVVKPIYIAAWCEFLQDSSKVKVAHFLKENLDSVDLPAEWKSLVSQSLN